MVEGQLDVTLVTFGTPLGRPNQMQKLDTHRSPFALTHCQECPHLQTLKRMRTCL